jgi:hypothetical protein
LDSKKKVYPLLAEVAKQVCLIFGCHGLDLGNSNSEPFFCFFRDDTPGLFDFRRGRREFFLGILGNKIPPLYGLFADDRKFFLGFFCDSLRVFFETA